MKRFLPWLWLVWMVVAVSVDIDARRIRRKTDETRANAKALLQRAVQIVEEDNAKMDHAIAFCREQCPGMGQ